MPAVEKKDSLEYTVSECEAVIKEYLTEKLTLMALGTDVSMQVFMISIWEKRLKAARAREAKEEFKKEQDSIREMNKNFKVVGLPKVR